MSTRTRDRKAAEFLLRESGLSLAQCVRLVLDALDALPRGLEQEERTRALRESMRLGAEAWAQRRSSITYGEAVERLLVIKAGRSRRTVQDIRQCLRKLGEVEGGWKGRLLGSITRGECAQRLEELFPSASRRVKARAVLSGLFNEGIRREWCRENPAKRVETPRIREREICALQPQEIERLLGAAKQHDGGGRHVPICPALRAILEQARHPAAPAPESRICPGNWVVKWRSIRHAAGFKHWQQDVLRHTFASYFAKCYRDWSALQLLMGHSNQQLLRTRYVNLRGLSLDATRRFWQNHTRGRYAPRAWYAAMA